ncbi:hypothetical protein BKA70DRAFT_1258492 [Coprinopsis sp. MPI-PUGE-AT-0042]|nr:hypothetical protein BKA70DRAFT_1258492 [Coprinopsis sp. MPI-PUGE-AT-0042]
MDPQVISAELSDRGDNAKITMQTRVAVRDKDPHRFQVVPLREAAKQGAPPSPRTVLFSRPQARASKIYVHRDEPEARGTKQLSRSKRTARREPVLQAKDVNISLAKGKHRKTESMEADRVQHTNTRSHRSLLEPPISSHDPLIQYSYTLKPFKILPAGASPDLGAAQTATGGGDRPKQWAKAIPSDLSAGAGAPESKIGTGDEPAFLSPIASNPRDTEREVNQRQDDQFAMNETPVGLRYAHSGPYSFRPTAGNSQKRHAIYASTNVLPDVKFLGELQSPATTESTERLLTWEEAGEDAIQSPRVQTLQPFTPSLVNLATFAYATRPLNVVPRSSTSSLHLLDSGYPVYPSIVSDLLDELDREILSWNCIAL